MKNRIPLEFGAGCRGIHKMDDSPRQKQLAVLAVGRLDLLLQMT